MKKRPQPVFLGIVLGIILLASSCTKKPQDLPAPAAKIPVGPSISGHTQPAGAILSVFLVDTTTHQTIVHAVPSSQGAYQFDAVPPGTYDLFFNKQRGYVRPRQRRVPVTAGNTTVVPPVVVVQCTGSVTANGVARPVTLVDLSLGFDGITLLPPALFSLILSDNRSTGGADTYRLHLNLPYAVRVGTYPLDGTSMYAIFTDANAGVFDSRRSLPAAPAGGTLTVTGVENTQPYPRSVSGMFRFTGTDPARGTQHTVSGTFDNAYF